MAPAKADVECVVKSSKRKESEDNGLSSITSSLTCLTLNTDSEKDLAGLEAGFLQICLGEKPVQLEHLEKQVEQEEEKETQVEQKEEEEKQVEQKEKKDVSDEEGERDSEKEEDNEKKIITVKVLQECKSSEDGKEEEKKEEEKENEVKAVEVESLDKLDLKEKEKEVVPDDEDKTKDKKEYTKEEEVSDSENLSDGDNKNSQPQPKDGKLRSRGFGNAMSQNCMNNEAYHQQHYPQNQEMWSQQHQYPAFLVPQHVVQEGGYPGSSPTGALDKVEDDMSSVSYGYSAESPLGYQNAIPINSPQYQENQASQYQKYHDCQPLLYHQQEDNQALSFHQGLSQNIQYQENKAAPYYQGSPQILSPLSYQESPSPIQILSNSHLTQSQGTHPTFPTPPVSPQPTTTSIPVSHSEDDIEEIISYVMDEVPLEISHNDSTIESIIRNLLEIRNGCHRSLEEILDKELLDLHIKGFAKMKNEDLVTGDADGDIYYTRILCTGQMEPEYNEKIAACTKRIERMDLCCDTVVDWRVKQCQICGNSDLETFYSPLSWCNNHGEMPLSSLVMLLFPPLVVEYLTRKVMQRPMDFRRTFVKNYEYFNGKTKLYPCLLEGLKLLQSA